MALTLKEPQRLKHFTPLRYPGGKAKLAPFIKKILSENGLIDGEYVEPYAGGAGVGLELLFHEYVSKIHINDISRPIYCFWSSILSEPERFIKLIKDTKLTVREWDRQKKILSHPDDNDDLVLGFATFFLNRTNRSGILNGGIIGGREQTGTWKIDARYNADELAYRVKTIAKMKNRISITRMDAIPFIKKMGNIIGEKTLFYLDPPYFEKGKDLYLDFYTLRDHELVAETVLANLKSQHWIVSYDNVMPIRQLYRGISRATYTLGYSAREVRTGTEVMFFSKGLKIPAAIGPIKFLSRRLSASRT